ncbi:hypothetical protein TURU_104595 [Turdus rufiventris]|nr:hypothetical protein TURU_104595 [Turdus rufiventris]
MVAVIFSKLPRDDPDLCLSMASSGIFLTPAVENPEVHSETKGSMSLLKKEMRFKDKGFHETVILYEHKVAKFRGLAPTSKFMVSFGYCTTQPSMIGKLAEEALDPTVRVTDKDIEQHRFQDQSQGTLVVTGLCLDQGALENNFLS